MKRQKSGYTTSWEIFADNPDVEILSLSGYSRHHVQVRARDAGHMYVQGGIGTAIRVDLFKVGLQSLVLIVLVFRFVDSCFFLVTAFVINTTSVVFWSFIVGHGCKLSPGSINTERS